MASLRGSHDFGSNSRSSASGSRSAARAEIEERAVNRVGHPRSWLDREPVSGEATRRPRGGPDRASACRRRRRRLRPGLRARRARPPGRRRSATARCRPGERVGSRAGPTASSWSRAPRGGGGRPAPRSSMPAPPAAVDDACGKDQRSEPLEEARGDANRVLRLHRRDGRVAGGDRGGHRRASDCGHSKAVPVVGPRGNLDARGRPDRRQGAGSRGGPNRSGAPGGEAGAMSAWTSSIVCRGLRLGAGRPPRRFSPGCHEPRGCDRGGARGNRTRTRGAPRSAPSRAEKQSADCFQASYRACCWPSSSHDSSHIRAKHAQAGRRLTQSRPRAFERVSPRAGHPRNKADAPRNPTPPAPTTEHARNQGGRSRQMRLPLEAARTWGGARKGAGRKPRGRPSMPHVTRPKSTPGVRCRSQSGQRPGCRHFDQRGCSARSAAPSPGLRSIAFG